MERRSLLILLAITACALVIAVMLLSTRNTTPAATSTVATTAASGSTVPDSAAGSTATPETTRPVDETTTTPPPVTLPPGTTVCDSYTTITSRGTIASTDLVEASGLAASRTRPGVLWSHNDSRDGARVYAIGEDGSDLGGFDIAGALAFDWEDMAAGPGSDPATSMLYFGDIGDNFSIRDGRITVYRLPEPDPASLTDSIEGSVALEYAYPDGTYNAEALFVSDGSIFIVTKDRDDTRVYRGDATGDGNSVVTLELVTELHLDAEVSGADISWDGTTIALRGYRTVWLWFRPPGSSIADTFATDPCTAPSPEEVQGESVAFLSDGSYATVSEGRNADLFVVTSES
jgi:hypothetical protein